MPSRDPTFRRWFVRGPGRTGSILLLLAVGVLLLVAWLMARHADDTHPSSQIVVIHAYSALDDVLDDGLLPAFRARWKQQTGEAVEFVTTFGGSGAITERILARVPAQVALLSSEIDARRLAPRIVRPDAWKNLPHGGVLGQTPIVLRVREGNPKGIADFGDLVSDDVDVVLCDPATSGLGVWTLLAVYGSAFRRTSSPAEALAQARALAARPVDLLPNARAAGRFFETAGGDVRPAYEADVLGTPSRSPPPGEVVRPPRTILCEPVVVVIRRYVAAGQRRLVHAFVAFLWSPQAQAILREYGFQPPGADTEATGIEDPFTLADLGGPDAAHETVLDILRRGPDEGPPPR